MRHIATLLVLLAPLAAAVGCESDVDKLKRLQEDRASAALIVWYEQKMIDSLSGIAVMLEPNTYPSHRLRSDTVQRKLDSARTDLAKAQLTEARAESQLRKLLDR